jgi:PEP-CTERM motif
MKFNRLIAALATGLASLTAAAFVITPGNEYQFTFEANDATRDRTDLGYMPGYYLFFKTGEGEKGPVEIDFFENQDFTSLRSTWKFNASPNSTWSSSSEHKIFLDLNGSLVFRQISGSTDFSRIGLGIYKPDGLYIVQIAPQVSSVPEASSLFMFGLGIAGFLLRGHRNPLKNQSGI